MHKNLSRYILEFKANRSAKRLDRRFKGGKLSYDDLFKVLESDDRFKGKYEDLTTTTPMSAMRMYNTKPLSYVYGLYTRSQMCMVVTSPEKPDGDTYTVFITFDGERNAFFWEWITNHKDGSVEDNYKINSSSIEELIDVLEEILV